MANNLSVNASVQGSVNGLTINSSGANSYTPTGSIVIAESVFVQTGSYQLIITGSSQPISTIYVGNSSNSASINVVLSGSNGNVNNLGNVSVSNGTNNSPSVIQWNQTFNSIWAQAVTTGSYVIFVVASQ